MLQVAWDQIEQFYNLTHIDPATVAKFHSLKNTQNSHTKNEGNPRHYCVFFLPFDKITSQIYLGHHKKANDWIPPGGHIEPGETPVDAAVREMEEELRVTITKDMLEPYTLSVKPINRPESGCMTHFDVWYLVHMPVQQFHYLESEYHSASWFTIETALTKITKNPDFAVIIAKIIDHKS